MTTPQSESQMAAGIDEERAEEDGQPAALQVVGDDEPDRMLVLRAVTVSGAS